MNGDVDWQRAGPLDREFLQPRDRSGERADLLQRLDLPAVEMQQRLHGESCAEQCLCGANPPAPAKVLQRVEAEERRRLLGAPARYFGNLRTGTAAVRGVGCRERGESEPHPQ